MIDLAAYGDCLAVGVLMFIAGLAVPFEYGLRRIRGFGRYMADKIPSKE